MKMPQTCIDAETLAAFVDGTLDAAERTRVIAHIATCEDCARLLAEVTSTHDELQDSASTPGNVPVVPSMGTGTAFASKRGRLGLLGGALAIAASVFFVIFNRSAPLDPLVGIVANERLTLARPTGGFHHGPLRSPTRGAADERLDVAAEAARLRAHADRTGAADDLHAAGVAQMLAGDADAGVRYLESAVRSNAEDTAIRADLGAAYMTRFLGRGDQADAAAALDALDRALAGAPGMKEAWFNKAILLEQLNRGNEAIAAWTRYLEVETDEGWRREGANALDALRTRTPRG